MKTLNYHHLRYFREVALEGNLTKAAGRLRVSQSALSTQIRQLEESLGERLFSREHKSLVLTEAGQTALDYAETIFHAGSELMQTLKHGVSGHRQIMRMGAMSTLSRNFQRDFLRPILGRDDVDLVLRSGSLRELMEDLAAHQLDIVLTNLAVKRDASSTWHCHLLAEQPVSLVGPARKRRKKFRFPEDLESMPVQLPGLESHLRVEFDRVMDLAGIRPLIAAEVDDMTMLRLLAREGHALTLVPPVVVADELKQGTLREWCRIPEISEKFYAVVPMRKKPNPLVHALLKADSRSFRPA
ncbi:MAG: LysR family transcriptional regulator [Terrimicrobiaceae bacterium]